MLSTQYRLRLEAICKDIASGTEVSIDDSEEKDIKVIESFKKKENK